MEWSELVTLGSSSGRPFPVGQTSAQFQHSHGVSHPENPTAFHRDILAEVDTSAGSAIGGESLEWFNSSFAGSWINIGHTTTVIAGSTDQQDSLPNLNPLPFIILVGVSSRESQIGSKAVH